MSSNRQQLATGLKAILGGGQHLREAPIAAPAEQQNAADAVDSGVDPVVDPGNPPPVPTEQPAAPAPEPQIEKQAARKAKRSPEALPQLATGSRVGTLERPYVRQRDNQPTRKVGVVLPVDLADELQIYCVRARMRPNAFIEQAIQDALERAR